MSERAARWRPVLGQQLGKIVVLILQEIERIDNGVNHLPIPLAFANQLYDLRGHIDVARRRLMALRSASA